METLEDVIKFLSKSFPEYYPSKPIGKDNPYYCCASCGRPDPEIGAIEDHYDYCDWVEGRKAILVLNRAITKEESL